MAPMKPRRWSRDTQALVLASLLLVLPLRRVLAEDRLDLKYYFYKEDSNRVQSWGPSFHWETDLNPETTLKIGGVFDAISGATPTGAPLTQKTHAKTIVVPVGATGGTTTTVAVSGASGRTSSTTTVTTAPQILTQKVVVQVPYGPHYLPMQAFNDERVALNGELSRRLGDYILTGGLAVSNESDYNSFAASLKLDREFNNKNTVVSAGFSITHDLVKDIALHSWDDKNTLEGLIGLTQVIDPRTLFTIDYTFGSESGFLNDQYKVAQVGTDIIPEQRPKFRDRNTIYMSLSHFFDCLNGSIETDYRYYKDSYGIRANTVDVRWNQKIGSQLIISPNVRYYQQTAADFYAVQFAAPQPFFSADYRLSRLATLGYGVTVTWKPSAKFAVDAGYERYAMWGLDGGATPAAAYPNANMVTLGVKIWF